jgi:ABC-2 type transport system permease protein
MLAKPFAFLKRDLRIAMTYRISFVHSLLMLVFGLISLEFTAQFINEGAPESLARYGNDYFGFALIGLATALFAQGVVGLFPGAVRSAQVTGTLEVMFAGRTATLSFLAGSALYGSCYALFRFGATVLIGALALGAQIQFEGLPLALIAFLLTACTFAGVGILAASFVLWFKQSEPFTGLFLTLSLLFSGVLYPTTVLPDWLEKLAALLPLTHTITVMRSALLQNGDISAAVGGLAVLTAYTLLVPLGIGAFAIALRRAKADGLLSQY